MLIVSAPGNLETLEHFRDVSRKPAGAEGLAQAHTRALAKEARRSSVFVGGLHATVALPAERS